MRRKNTQKHGVDMLILALLCRLFLLYSAAERGCGVVIEEGEGCWGLFRLVMPGGGEHGRGKIWGWCLEGGVKGEVEWRRGI